jgi:hypothetical protein
VCEKFRITLTSYKWQAIFRGVADYASSGSEKEVQDAILGKYE